MTRPEDPNNINRLSERVNSLFYPQEYFTVQVLFAQRLARITGKGFNDRLLNNTSMYRQIIGRRFVDEGGNIDDLWEMLVSNIADPRDPFAVARLLFALYASQPHSKYGIDTFSGAITSKRFGAFSFKYLEANGSDVPRGTIQIHFSNLERGPHSPLSQSLLAQRQLDVKGMFDHIRETYHDAEDVIGESWLYSLSSYRGSFPHEYVENMCVVVPEEFDLDIPNSVPGLVFDVDSLWGQFVNRYGNVRSSAYDHFIYHIENASNLGEIFQAFPTLPLRTTAPVDTFYKWSV